MFEHEQLDAQVIAIDGDRSSMIVKLSGGLKMKHTFYHKPDGNVAEAKVVGFVVIDRETSELRTFELTTSEATYGGGRFAIGVSLGK